MLTDQEYETLAKRVYANRDWTLAYCAEHRTNAIPVGACPADLECTNAERSAVEQYEFNRDKPDSYFAYVKRPKDMLVKPHWRTLDQGELTTWTGDKLGDITFGRVWRDNFGGLRVPITVRAITGELYHGTYFTSSGDYARIRKAKPRKAR